MKESISYSFVLNIVILFIFICMTIIMGIFSYYRAFKANTIIVQAIEKNEGYNCISQKEIARKLDTISYFTPFDVTCDGKDKPCSVDSNKNYAVVSYNLDVDGTYKYIYTGFETNEKILQGMATHGTYRYFSTDTREAMNSKYKCVNNECTTGKYYQFGVYTYMYVDMPVINHLLRIPYFSKTKIMYEFRNFYVLDAKDVKKQYVSDIGFLPPNSFEYVKKDDGKIYVVDKFYKNDSKGIVVNPELANFYYTAIQKLGGYVMNLYSYNMTEGSLSGGTTFKNYVEHKTSAIGAEKFVLLNYADVLASIGETYPDSNFVTQYMLDKGAIWRHDCGYVMDFNF